MRIPPTALAAALTLAATGCGDVTPEPRNAVEVTAPEASQDRLERLSGRQLNAVLVRAIRDAGRPCRYIESAERTGEHRGLPLWSARCETGITWTIVVGNDGTLAVWNPAEAAALGNQAAGNRQDR